MPCSLRERRKAGCAVGRSILVIVWHLLNDPAARYTDLGPDWHARHADRSRKAPQRPAPTRGPRLRRHARDMYAVVRQAAVQFVVSRSARTAGAYTKGPLAAIKLGKCD